MADLIAGLFITVDVLTVVVGIRAYRGLMQAIPEAEQLVPWWVVATVMGAIQMGAIVILILFIVN